MIKASIVRFVRPVTRASRSGAETSMHASDAKGHEVELYIDPVTQFLHVVTLSSLDMIPLCHVMAFSPVADDRSKKKEAADGRR